jgi:hypothetical protein
MISLANTVIDRMGGTTAAANYFEIEPASISGWRKKGIPKLRLQWLRLVRPELFADLEEHATEQAAA